MSAPTWTPSLKDMRTRAQSHLDHARALLLPTPMKSERDDRAPNPRALLEAAEYTAAAFLMLNALKDLVHVTNPDAVSRLAKAALLSDDQALYGNDDEHDPYEGETDPYEGEQ